MYVAVSQHLFSPSLLWGAVWGRVGGARALTVPLDINRRSCQKIKRKHTLFYFFVWRSVDSFDSTSESKCVQISMMAGRVPEF
jgi:hypothetical protein